MVRSYMTMTLWPITPAATSQKAKPQPLQVIGTEWSQLGQWLSASLFLVITSNSGPTRAGQIRHISCPASNSHLQLLWANSLQSGTSGAFPFLCSKLSHSPLAFEFVNHKMVWPTLLLQQVLNKQCLFFLYGWSSFFSTMVCYHFKKKDIYMMHRI